jgi:hypothetical protein
VAWKTIESAFGSQTHARVVNNHSALATTEKGNRSITEYINKMHTLANEMGAVGKPLDYEEMVSHILAGLDLEYTSVVLVIVTHVEPISVNELYGQLLSYESRQVLLQGGSNISNTPPPLTNAAMRGRGDFGRGHGEGRGHGTRGRTSNHSNVGHRTTTTTTKPMVGVMSARSTRRATLLFSVGTILMIAMTKNEGQMLLPPACVGLTPIGTTIRCHRSHHRRA